MMSFNLVTTNPANQNFSLLENSIVKKDFIGGLPIEIVLKILSYLSSRQTVRVMLVCRNYYKIASDEQLWRKSVFHLLNRQPNMNFILDGTTWKERYKNLFLIRKSAYQTKLELNHITQNELDTFYQTSNLKRNLEENLQAIESFQGLYGIKLDEIGIDTKSKQEDLPVISLDSYVESFDGNALRLKKSLQKLPKEAPRSISCRAAFRYVVKQIFFQLENSAWSDFDHISISCPRGGFLKPDDIQSSLSNIDYLRSDLLPTDIPRREGANTISWEILILTILKERHYIHSYAFDRNIIFATA